MGVGKAVCEAVGRGRGRWCDLSEAVGEAIGEAVGESADGAFVGMTVGETVGRRRGRWEWACPSV